MTKKIILASSSPRRQALLRQINIPFTIREQCTDESQITTSNPLEKVKQLAILKSKILPILKNEEVILTADTVVSYKQQIFEKPKDRIDAAKMISMLSGDIHEVYTGVMIRSINKEIVFTENTMVEFWPISKADIDWYISTKEPYDKAGAYGIQSLGAIFVKQIIGDYYNVMGLPISRLVMELKQFNINPGNN